jgi:hypothetical protein
VPSEFHVAGCGNTTEVECPLGTKGKHDNSARGRLVGEISRKYVTGNNRLGCPFSKTDKRLLAIAALGVEVEMTEAHVRRLSTIRPELTDSEQQDKIAALVKEEKDRAEMLRRKIDSLRDQA